MAQSGAADSGTLEKIIDRLADFEPTGLPVISLYLNAQANERGRQDFDRFLRKEFPERARTYPAHTPERESFDRDAGRVREYLAGELRADTNGVAVFACAGAGDFFEAGMHHQIAWWDIRIGGTVGHGGKCLVLLRCFGPLY